MKRTFLTLLFTVAALVCFISCSSDSDTSQSPLGQYIYQNDTLTMAVEFNDKSIAVVHVFIRNSIEYQDLYEASYTGDFPNYVLRSKGGDEPLIMNCTFSSSNSFSGVVTQNGLEHVYWLYKYRHILLPQTMLFRKDSRILDKNGDGILDWTQGVE